MFTTTTTAIWAAFARQAQVLSRVIGEVITQQPDLRRYLQRRQQEDRGSKLGRRLHRNVKLGRLGSF